MSTGNLFEEFVEVIRRLRDPNGGCPWDLEQNHQTLRPYLIEEAYEVLEAIDAQNDKELAGELGDVLLQVVIHAQVAKDRQAFAIEEVIRGVTEKMIRRHPHVFGQAAVSGSADVLKNWEQIKKAERQDTHSAAETKAPSILDGVPKVLPALLRAQRLGEKAARCGFDWREFDGVWAKVQEELAEFKVELDKNTPFPPQALTTAPPARPAAKQQALEAEFGDLLFSLCQVARWFGVSAEDSLRVATERFTSRFQSMENSSTRPLKELSEAELDTAWEAAKARLQQV